MMISAHDSMLHGVRLNIGRAHRFSTQRAPTVLDVLGANKLQLRLLRPSGDDHVIHDSSMAHHFAELVHKLIGYHAIVHLLRSLPPSIHQLLGEHCSHFRVAEWFMGTFSPFVPALPPAQLHVFQLSVIMLSPALQVIVAQTKDILDELPRPLRSGQSRKHGVLNLIRVTGIAHLILAIVPMP